MTRGQRPRRPSAPRTGIMAAAADVIPVALAMIMVLGVVGVAGAARHRVFAPLAGVGPPHAAVPDQADEPAGEALPSVAPGPSVPVFLEDGAPLEPRPLTLGLHTGPDPLAAAAYMPVVAALGATTVPVDLVWDRVQPAPDHFAWEDYDFAVQRGRAHGLRLVGVLHYPPGLDWPGDGGQRAGWPSAHRGDWHIFVKQVVARYSWAIADWIVVRDEPPDVDPLLWAREAVAYAQFVQDTAGVIRQLQPEAQIRAVASAVDLLWLEVFIREGGLTGLAGLVLEANRWPAAPEGLPVVIEDVRGLARELGHDPDLWVWRFGYPTHQGVSATVPHRRGVTMEQQAAYVVRSHVWLARAGVGLVLYHQVIDRGWELEDASSNFGLFHRDGQAKPSAQAYQTLARRLGGRIYGLPHPATPGAADDVTVDALGLVLDAIRQRISPEQELPNIAVHPFAAGPGDGLVVVMWVADPTAREPVLVLPVDELPLPDEVQVRISALDGSPVDRLVLGFAPVYVEIGKRVDVARRLGHFGVEGMLH